MCCVFLFLLAFLDAVVQFVMLLVVKFVLLAASWLMDLFSGLCVLPGFGSVSCLREVSIAFPRLCVMCAFAQRVEQLNGAA